ncbi:TPA: hypothetical protein ACS3JV_002529 [Klebsiella oxytoca]
MKRISGTQIVINFIGSHPGCTFSEIRTGTGLDSSVVNSAIWAPSTTDGFCEQESEQEHLRPVGVMSEKAFHRLENSECRFIALWPRPGVFLPRKLPEDGVIVYARTAAAADKVEAG